MQPEVIARGPSAAAAGIGKWELVGLLWVAFFLNQADRQVFNVVLPLIRTDLQLSDVLLGAIATTFTVVYGILVPFSGWLGDLIDRRKLVILSLVVFSTGTLLTGFASSFLLLLLFRGVATGAGEALYAPAASSLIGEAHVGTRARALAIHQTANYTGIVLGSLVAGATAQAFGWRAAFYAYGIAGVAWSVVLVWRMRRYPVVAPVMTDTLRDERRAIWRDSVAMIVRTPTLIGLMISFGGLIFVMVGFLTWTPTYLFERFDVSIAYAGFSSVFYHHLLAYIGLLLASWLTDRWIGRIPRARLLTMAFGLLGSAVFLWWTAAAGELWQVYTALAGFGFFRGLYDHGIFAAIFDAVENRLRATITGLVLASGFLVGALSPFVMGAMKAEYGLEGGFRVLAGSAMVAGLILLAITMRAPPRPAIGYGPPAT